MPVVYDDLGGFIDFKAQELKEVLIFTLHLKTKDLGRGSQRNGSKRRILFLKTPYSSFQFLTNKSKDSTK